MHQHPKPASAGRTLAILLPLIGGLALIGHVIDQRRASERALTAASAVSTAAPTVVDAGVAPAATEPAAIAPDNMDGIHETVADLFQVGLAYDWRLNPPTRTLRIAVLPGTVPDGYGETIARKVCGRLWLHGVTTIGGGQPVVRLVRQIDDWSEVATVECP